VDQQIGIAYGVKGEAAIMDSITRMETLMNSLATTATAATGKMATAFNSAFVPLTTKLSTIKTELGTVTRQMEALARASKSVTPPRVMGAGGGAGGRVPKAAIMDSITRMETLMNSLATTATAATGKMATAFNSAFAPLTTKLSTIKTELGTVTRQMEALARASKSVTPLRVMGAGGGAGGRVPKDDSIFGMSMDKFVPFFMMRWMLWGGLIHGAKSLMENVVLGKAREKLVEPESVLAGSNLSREQILATERRGWEFVKRNPHLGSIKDYLDAAGEVISGFSMDLLSNLDPKGAQDQVDRMTRMSMLVGKWTKTTPEVMARLLSKTAEAQLMFMPEAERLKYETGQKQYASLVGEVMGEVASVVITTHAWGRDLANVATYTLPSALELGMSTKNILAMYGALVSGGQKPQLGARGMRSFLEKGGVPLMQLFAAGGPDPKLFGQLKDLRGPAKESFNAQIGTIFMQAFAKDPVAWFKRMTQWYAKAKDQFGPGILKQIGFDPQWRGQLEMMLTPGYFAKMEQQLKRIEEDKNLSEEEKARKLEEIIAEGLGQDVRYMRLKNAWAHMMSEWDLMAQKSEQVMSFAASITTAIDTLGGYFRGTNTSMQAGTAAAEALYSGVETFVKFMAEWRSMVHQGMQGFWGGIIENSVGKENHAKASEWGKYLGLDKALNLFNRPQDYITKEGVAGGLGLNNFAERYWRYQQNVNVVAGWVGENVPKYAPIAPGTPTDTTGTLAAPSAGESATSDLLASLKQTIMDLGERLANIHVENHVEIDGEALRTTIRETNRRDAAQNFGAYGTNWGSPY